MRTSSSGAGTAGAAGFVGAVEGGGCDEVSAGRGGRGFRLQLKLIASNKMHTADSNSHAALLIAARVSCLTAW